MPFGQLAFDLLERAAEPGQGVLGMPMPLSVIAMVTMPPRARPCTVTAPPSGREFHRVGQQIERDLLERPAVGAKRGCRARRRKQSRCFSDGAAPDHAQAVGENPVEFDSLGRQPDAAGFDLRHVEDVVDDVEQIVAAFADVAGIFAVFFGAERSEHGGFHDFGKADDGVERRAQLVAHVGEEFRFGLVGFLGAGLLLGVFFGEIGELLGLQLQRLLGFAQVGDGGDLTLLALDQFLFVLLDLGDVGADRNIAAVLGAALADMQPAAVVELSFEGAGARRLAGVVGTVVRMIGLRPAATTVS